MSKLFTPLNVGALELAHRLVTPLGLDDDDRGRVRATLSATEHADHATPGGLLITGPCRVSVQGAGVPGQRGLDEADIPEWRRVTEAVHERGGLIVAQLSHAGAVAHSSLNREGPVGASSIRVAETVLDGRGSRVNAEKPRALDQSGIDAVVEDYRRASHVAREAGFDGVEVAGTTGSLLGQFLLETTNAREDDYGGAIDNRITFLSQVVETVGEVWTPGRVGVRLSPWDSLRDHDAPGLFARVLESLADQEIAWVHLVQMDASAPLDLPADSEECRLARHFRSAFPSTLLFSRCFTLPKALAAVDRRLADAVGLHESLRDPHFIGRVLATHRASGGS